MSILSWEKDGNVAIVTMGNGENRMNLDFATAMNGMLDEILDDTSVQSLIITSSDEKNFSQGVDIQWLGQRMQKQELQLIRKFLYGMNDIFKRLLLYPVPTIAAINGHAFGDGAIMSCACDFRFMKADRGYFCFPEVDLGIPFFPGMNAFCKKAVPYYKFQEMQFSGKRYGAKELEEHHIIVKACADRDDLMKESISFAKTFQKRRGIYGELKKRMYKDIIYIIEKEDPELCIEPLNVMVSE